MQIAFLKYGIALWPQDSSSLADKNNNWKMKRVKKKSSSYYVIIDDHKKSCELWVTPNISRRVSTNQYKLLSPQIHSPYKNPRTLEVFLL